LASGVAAGYGAIDAFVFSDGDEPQPIEAIKPANRQRYRALFIDASVIEVGRLATVVVAATECH
jgi:hypothetical protein